MHKLNNTTPVWRPTRQRLSRLSLLLVLASMTFLLAACGLFGGGSDEETSAVGESTRAIVPTWTSTPASAAPTPSPTIAFETAPTEMQAEVADQSNAPASTSVFNDLTPAAAESAAVDTAPAADAAAPTETPTAAPKARLTVTQAGINVRTGPGTNYGVGGTANTGDVFDIIAKNSAGDWWQVCCVSGEPVWIYSELATVENVENVPAASNIPEPVVAAPAPTAAPEPEPTTAPEPAAPAAEDPCANIGGDGCKFKLTGGPSFASNGGGELKLTLAFIHSGIDGGQPQGSYFVVLLKDGQNVGVPDSVRSFDPSVGFRDGPNGRYNYEWKIGASDLPGGNIQGNYQIWVLDGNGERDSQTFSFTVPEGQGEVWITFDQA